ncbi:MAG TPA: chromosomal replication initiator protein DnaA [Chloroflexi bacterium]|nr:MAG: chromosomal replication initiator protein DnaA [Chloroflexota bacterium]HFB06982.1 chromosomal replication initiator protein DnaA [Chloroflexota bacterium]
MLGVGIDLEPAKEIWKRALGKLQIQISKANYTTWLSNSQGLSYQDNTFLVGVPNIFVAEWLSKRLYPLVRKTLIDIIDKDVDVKFVVHNREQLPASPLARQTDGGTSSKATQHRFNPKYTFDNLVVSDFNRLAYAAAVEVAENPGSSYNPLFIHSSTGQGKTHLLHAIGHLTISNGLQAAYITGEQFANEFVHAVRENQVDKFRSKFRSIQILLFDDMHFLIDKKQTLQCFFHTFNELYNNNHQIVITADCAPKDMHSLNNKLRSRLEGGLVVDIQPPDYETRLEILRAKTAKAMNQQLEGVLHMVAEKVCDNVRQLEGALVYLTAQAKLTGATLTPQIINKLLTCTTPKQDIKLILQTVADYFNLAVEALISKKKDRKTTLARHIAIYLIREEHNCSLTEIGKELGGRNHATILHGYEKIASELSINPNLANQIAEIKGNISSQKGHRGA